MTYKPGFDVQRVLEWIRNGMEPRAVVAFTAGDERQAAYLCEYAVSEKAKELVKHIAKSEGEPVMTTVNVSRSLLRKVIAHFADSIHEFREAETAPDGSIEIESQEMIEGEERLLAELRQALASAEQDESHRICGCEECRGPTPYEAEQPSVGHVCGLPDSFCDGSCMDAATTPPQEPVAWYYCPECGETEYQETHINGERVCRTCGQSWFADVDYSERVRSNLSERLSRPPANDEAVRFPIGGYAPGRYQCKCIDCRMMFYGDKRSVQCLACAQGVTINPFATHNAQEGK